MPTRGVLQDKGRDIEDDVIELPPRFLEKYKITRRPSDLLASAQESAIEGETARASAAGELLRSRIDRANDRKQDLGFMACAEDLVSSPRAKKANGSYLATRQGKSPGSSKADAKAAALEALAAEEKTAEAKMSQGGEEARATTDRSHEMANPPKTKARKEGQELTGDQKARAREYARRAREEGERAKGAGKAQEYQHGDMEVEAERDDTFGVAAYTLCDVSTPL